MHLQHCVGFCLILTLVTEEHDADDGTAGDDAHDGTAGDDDGTAGDDAVDSTAGDELVEVKEK